MGGFETFPIGKPYWEIQAQKDFITNSLKNLKNLINNDPGITKQPRLEKGAAVFNYKYMGWDWEIVTRKDINGKYSVRIKKMVRLPNGKEGWKTQKNGDNDTFIFDAKDKNAFNRCLGAALDKTIGKNRDRLPTTGGFVYNLLNNGNTTEKEQPKTTTQKKEQQKTNKTPNVTKKGNTSAESQESKEFKEMPKGLVFDHGTYIYTVQPGDSEEKIKRKLEGYTPLTYLKGMPNGIEGYNFDTIPDDKLLPGLRITIPKNKSERIKTISDFRNTQKLALNEMKNNPIYGSEIKRLLKKYPENHIVNVMTAYAKSETCPKDYDDKVGKFALFRYEKAHKCPSYGYHHVMHEGVGLPAFRNTGLSIGQSCNPKDSGKLFLAFCIEKVKTAKNKENRDFTKFFNMKDTERCAKWYNGVDIKEYSEKLGKNFNKVKSS